MARMAVIKATYTRSPHAAKAAIRYIEHRPGRDGKRQSRALFNTDGTLARYEAYRLIDEAPEGVYFYRVAISPDPGREDTKRDLFLRDIAEKTMLQFSEQVQTPLAWIAAEHDDHAPHRHIHVLAIAPRKLQVHDLRALREAATMASHQQRQERDQAREHRQERAREREEWEEKP
jgi:hypothetical protein